MNRFFLCLLFASVPILAAPSCQNPNVHPDAGPTPVVSSQPIPVPPPPPPPSTGGAKGTGGAAGTGGALPVAVVGLSCTAGEKLARSAPRNLLGWVAAGPKRGGEPLKAERLSVDVSQPICWDSNDNANLVQTYGSCTGEGLIQCLSAAPRTRHAKQADAMTAYNSAIAPQHCPPDDPGSTLDDIMAAGVKLGWVGKWARLTSTLQVRAALRAGSIEFGADWTTGDDAVTSCGMVATVGQTRGGHAYACSCDFPKGLPGITTDGVIVCRNSWKDWGAVRRIPAGIQTGFFARRYADFDALFARGAEAVQPITPL